MSKSRRRRRDPTPITNQRLPTPRLSSPIGSLTSNPIFTPLNLVEDRRTWHPEGPTRPFRKLSGATTRISEQRPVKLNSDRLAGLRNTGRQAKTTHLLFDQPQEVAVCVRRKSRREVLFAKRQTGKSGQRRPRRNFTSDISCGRRKK